MKRKLEAIIFSVIFASCATVKDLFKSNKVEKGTDCTVLNISQEDGDKNYKWLFGNSEYILTGSSYDDYYVINGKKIERSYVVEIRDNLHSVQECEDICNILYGSCSKY